MKKTTLLIDEYPLIVLPSLAKEIGLNEAIALQQLHYWLSNPKGGVEINGEKWVYNTYEEWQEDNFPFWSIPTIQRTFSRLEKMGLVISMQTANYDRKKYYRIHHINLIRWKTSNWNDASYQDDVIEDINLIPSLTDTTTDTTTDTNRDVPAPKKPKANEIAEIALYREVTDRYPVKACWNRVVLLIHQVSQRIGHQPTKEDLLPYYEEWCARGWVSTSINWLEYAVKGKIPNGKNGTGINKTQAAIQQFLNMQQPSEVIDVYAE